jgi:hypothetical protein
MKMTKVHESMATDLAKLGGILRCNSCKEEMPLEEVRLGGFLSHGWPKCCGYTMTWVTQKLLDQEAAERNGKQ